MIRLFYSDRAPHLAQALAERIRAGRQRGDHPLEPVPLIVPDQATSSYLKMALAEALGVAANLRVEYLRAYLERLVADRVGIADAARLELLLVDVLGRAEVLAQPDLAPVRRYLDAAGDDRAARDLRRTQLARRLARLFDEYALTRPEMLARWRAEPSARVGPVERWERATWRALEGPLDAAGLAPLGAAFEGFAPAPGALPSSLHVFGVSVGGSVLQSVLARIGAHTELCLYVLNPCLEFWEDLRTGPDSAFLRERLTPRRPAPRPPESLFGDDPLHLGDQAAETPALRLWGRPGRENIRLLNELTDCDFEARFSDPSAPAETLLERLQRDVLCREPERADPSPERADGSVQLVACASLRREVEAIAAKIWALVDASKDSARPLRFHEIAVVLVGAEQDAYRAHIGAVFRERHDIPHTALDVPLSGSSRVVDAIELLLALPGSGFRRQDLLRLVTHPVVLSRYPDVTADEWLAWADALSVVHGADHADHAETYITRDLYNWDQGLRRLVLGTFMSGLSSGDERIFEALGQRYLPYEYSLDRLPGAAQLVVLVRSLIADARFVARASMPVADWAAYLRTLVSTYVTPDTEQDERDLLRVLATLQTLEGLHPGGDPVGFEVAAELVRTRLESLTSNRGQPLAEGVVVAPLALVASLPFRVVFVPGLSEGRFPASERRNQLDLRSQQRRAGDVSPRERDQYWFLERILATQDSLHLSWVSRSAQTGDRLEPSPTLQELVALLERGYLGKEGLQRITARQPLRRYATTEEDPFDSEAALRERQALALRADLGHHLGPRAEPPALLDLRARLPEPTWRAVARRLRLAEPPGAAEPERARIAVPYRALRRFLEDPLQGWAEHVLQLRQDDLEDDPFATEDERFRTERPDEQRLLLDVFIGHLEAPDTPLAALYERQAELLELAGAMPTGVFWVSERRRHLEILEAWRVQLRRAMQGRLRPVVQLRFGRAREHARVREVAEAIRIPLADGRLVELRGSTEPVVEDPAASFVVQSKDPSRGRARLQPELRCFLDHAVLAASGRRFERGYRGFVAYPRPDPEALDRVRYDAFTPEEARVYLAGLLTELLDDAHAYALPFTTAVGVHEARGKGRAALEEVLAQARPSPFGPLARAEVRPPSVDEVLDMVERRFGPYFARRTEEGSS